ncbi:ABC1 kinase family protein [Peptacetobacter sp.]|uniref:ABC1 kinase family protein n=1 Tax=Peptacetobacter sp. TaxID=2991975 RepID=UPI0026072747|nr:AarF/UbiB family protein [Peptacetobacter sp.]
MRISYRHIKRYKEIAQVMIKYGFSFIIERINKDGSGSKIDVSSSEPKDDIKNMTSGQRLRLALQELGPTYIKLGQILSTRRDLLDQDIIDELKKLRDNVKTFDTDIAIAIIEEEIGDEIENIFSDFDKNPIAAASIGQVYNAVLKSGEKVVVKVQRPDIEGKIKSDLEILKRVTSSIQDIIKDYNVDMKEMVEELSSQLLRELDYNFEAVNAIKMKKIFEYSDEVYIPTMHMEYTTKKVLIMEKIDGIKLSDIDLIKEKGWDTKKIANIGVKAFLKQVFSYGFFHADQHPGNIFVLNESKIAYIDFGMIGIIDNKMLNFLNRFALAASEKNVEKIVRVLSDIDAITDETDVEGFKQEMLYMIHYYYDVPLERISIGTILNEIFRFFRKYKIVMPSQLITLAKTVITLEGTGRTLDPDFSAKEISKAFLKHYYKNRVNPKNIAIETKQNVEEIMLDVKNIPKQIKNVLRMIEKNNIKISVEELKMTRIEDCLKELTTQMTMALVLASIIVGSSLIIASPNVEKNIWIKYMAIAGFFISFVIGLVLVIQIIKVKFKRR